MDGLVKWVEIFTIAGSSRPEARGSGGWEVSLAPDGGWCIIDGAVRGGPTGKVVVMVGAGAGAEAVARLRGWLFPWVWLVGFTRL